MNEIETMVFQYLIKIRVLNQKHWQFSFKTFILRASSSGFKNKTRGLPEHKAYPLKALMMLSRFLRSILIISTEEN